jgi:hypothetical protein
MLAIFPCAGKSAGARLICEEDSRKRDLCLYVICNVSLGSPGV